MKAVFVMNHKKLSPEAIESVRGFLACGHQLIIYGLEDSEKVQEEVKTIFGLNDSDQILVVGLGFDAIFAAEREHHLDLAESLIFYVDNTKRGLGTLHAAGIKRLVMGGRVIEL